MEDKETNKMAEGNGGEQEEGRRRKSPKNKTGDTASGQLDKRPGVSCPQRAPKPSMLRPSDFPVCKPDRTDDVDGKDMARKQTLTDATRKKERIGSGGKGGGKRGIFRL